METSRKRLRKCSRRAHIDTVQEDGPSRKRLRKCSRKAHTVQKDGPFSWLPDEIIVSHILPRLTLQEAVRCSVLSRRWEKLWTQLIGPKLLFSHEESNDRILGYRAMSELATNFADWITRVLKTYSKPSTLEELIVRHGFDSSSSQSLDGWVEYALRKGVARLELDLSLQVYSNNPKKYAFPSVKILSSLHPLCDYRLCEPVRCSGGFCNLRDLCLKNVDARVKAIQFMLSKCPLERFCLWNVNVLGNIKVSKKLIKLKNLEIVHCAGMQIDISASNLVSLKYFGDPEDLKTKPLPHLLELSIGDRCGNLFLRTGAKNFPSISQIRRLSLITPEEDHGETFGISLDFPTLVNLEQLELTMSSTKEDNVCHLWAIILIKAAPHLRSLSIKFMKERAYYVEQQDWSEIRKATKRVKHPRLEVIELHEFSGIPCQLELGRVLLDVSPSLKQLTVWPSLGHCDYTMWSFLLHGTDKPKPCDWWPIEKYRKRAQKFRRWMPNGVDFVVQ